MKQLYLGSLTAEELLERFVALGVDQDRAENDDDMPRVKRLFGLIDEVVTELKSRPDDQRSVLTSLIRLSKHERAPKGGKSNAGSCPTGRAADHRSNRSLDMGAPVLRCAHVSFDA
jgi:hypothetical protein